MFIHYSDDAVDNELKWVKYLTWAALAVNATLVLTMIIEPYFRAAPEY